MWLEEQVLQIYMHLGVFFFGRREGMLTSSDRPADALSPGGCGLHTHRNGAVTGGSIV